MKAVVFAAGIGTRLKPFTDSHPKALVPVCGTPAISLVLSRLVAAGASGIVVNVHHFSDQIRKYLADNDFGVPVEISDESKLLLDTAGALAKMARESTILADAAADEPVVVHNADIITDFSLQEMVGKHLFSGAAATILVEPRRQSTRAFLFDTDLRLRGWHNSTTGQTRPEWLSTKGLMSAPFGGVHVMRRDTLDHISADFPESISPLSITPWYLDHCDVLAIYGYTPTAPYRWHDIGTPEKLRAAENDFAAC